MRYVVGFLFVMALGIMGCSETAGSGGSAGSGGAAGLGGLAGSGGQGGVTCFQDDECVGSLICCHVGSPFTPGTCETQAVCDELQDGEGPGR